MFVTIMFAIIFTLISLTEFVTGFQWGYRIINVVAVCCWWLYYKQTKEPNPKPAEPLEPIELDEIE